MRLLYPAPALEAGEQTLFESSANVARGKRWLGARVVITDRRLLIVPDRLERRLGGTTVAIERDDIQSVVIEPRSPDVARARGFHALLHPQVEIVYRGGWLALTLRRSDDLVRTLQVGPG